MNCHVVVNAKWEAPRIAGDTAKKPREYATWNYNGRGERIRTFDILLPKQALYQTELHPETTWIITAFFINANFFIHLFFFFVPIGFDAADWYHIKKYFCMLRNSLKSVIIIKLNKFGRGGIT